MVELFTVPAGTMIEETESGLLIFCEPGREPYTLKIVASAAHPHFQVVKEPLASPPRSSDALNPVLTKGDTEWQTQT